MAMIARTKANGQDPFECVSTVQKAVRRNDPKLALHFALEMALDERKANRSWVLNSVLQTFPWEDCGPSDPVAVCRGVAAAEVAADSKDGTTDDWGPHLAEALVTLSRCRKTRAAADLWGVWDKRQAESPGGFSADGFRRRLIDGDPLGCAFHVMVMGKAGPAARELLYKALESARAVVRPPVLRDFVGVAARAALAVNRRTGHDGGGERWSLPFLNACIAVCWSRDDFPVTGHPAYGPDARALLAEVLAERAAGAFPAVPDWALDMHTTQGKRMGRGVQHFLDNLCLSPPAPVEDPWRDEAHAYWLEKFSKPQPKQPPKPKPPPAAGPRKPEAVGDGLFRGLEDDWAVEG